MLPIYVTWWRAHVRDQRNNLSNSTYRKAKSMLVQRRQHHSWPPPGTRLTASIDAVFMKISGSKEKAKWIQTSELGHNTTALEIIHKPFGKCNSEASSSC